MAAAGLGLLLSLLSLGAGGDWALLPEQPDLDPACQQLLGEVANGTAALSQCLVRFARPARLCRDCRPEYQQLSRQVTDIALALGNTSESGSCARNLLQSDRIQLILSFTTFFNNTWKDSKCEQCFQSDGGQMLNSTVTFLALFDALMVCFEQNIQGQTIIPLQPGNYSQVCRNCSNSYRKLNALYSQLEEEHALCIDLEDAGCKTQESGLIHDTTGTKISR
ncbi:osteopetrosis-associated transmembrane protein 1 isoform X2 [Rhinatrema bivittatum]|uniref:osteopetrosis-associated transmembrane protein 1 isoform X2 n=1 Tax=Rhinatrema bivittatum TaxID=194408 RepID=UPI0011289569|nr:osteopetrosis-associated transmembrane protein 1 isoform X2 [Rhinatrema bivittatum]